MDILTKKELAFLSCDTSLCFEPLTWINDDYFKRRVIVSAANKYTMTNGKEIILGCVRHSSPDLRATTTVLFDNKLLVHKHAIEQGFLDQYSNFWSREDAYLIADGAGQIDYGQNGSSVYLFSEGLY